MRVPALVVAASLSLFAASCGDSGAGDEREAGAVPSSSLAVDPGSAGEGDAVLEDSAERGADGDADAGVQEADAAPAGSAGEGAAEPADSAGEGDAVPAALAGEDDGSGTPGAREGEEIDWQECDGLSCGMLSVPLDYRDLDAGRLEMAVAVHRATRPESRLGYLFVNPGGPGASGMEMARRALDGPGAAFTAEVIERFDIVGFDPRGVGASEPQFKCGAPGEQLGLFNTVDLPYDTPEELAAGEAAVQLCVDDMGPATGLVHSEHAARDMDRLRDALGAEQISYYGASYGSTLGVWYATLFPQRVRAMVVDGADNPVDDVSTLEARIDSTIEELQQFEALLEEALAACASAACPIHNDGDPRGYFINNSPRLQDVAPAAHGNPAAGGLGVLTALYSQEYWPLLWQAMADLVERDDPSILAELAKIQLGDSTGGTTLTAHINCLDSWVIHPQLDRSVRIGDEVFTWAAVEERFSLITVLGLRAPTACPFYDLIAPPPLDGPLDGGGVPILVIGNPLDPATPFSESEELVEDTLANGHLLRADHPSHVVFPARDCVNEAVHAVLIDLEPPSQHTEACAA